ncbi:hypothetical protein FGO68_gene7391 [Halteria grandinella]|uniref:Zinc finger PHD-type domain-containing protein n=1 Tax=Halteria grandinella TaxID=5974 RepID=A0A8J8P4Q5_HALGN|nr:hypothetical protein FGO68_gene7391 [Halteria grandinella]
MVRCQACTEQRGKILSCHASCILLIKKDKADGRRFKYFLREDGQMMCKEHKRSEYSRANSAQRVAFRERISDISDDIQKKKKEELANSKKEQDSNKKRASKEERSQTKIDAYITPQKRASSQKMSQLEQAVRADSIVDLQNELEKIANQEQQLDAINNINEPAKQVKEQYIIDVPNENSALQEKKDQPLNKIPKQNIKQFSPILFQPTPIQNFDTQSQRCMVNILKKPTLEEAVAIEKKFDIISQSQKKPSPDILDFNKSLTEMISNHSSQFQGRYTHQIAPNHHKKSDLQIKGLSSQNQSPGFAVPKFPPMVFAKQQIDGLSSALIQPVNPYPIKLNSHILDYNPSKLVPFLQPYNSVQQTTVFPQKSSEPTKKKREEKQKFKQEPKQDIQKSDKSSTRQQNNQGEVKSRSKSAIWQQVSRNNRAVGGKFNRSQIFGQNHFKKPRSGTKSLKGPVQRHMNISSREEQKLSNLTIDWDLFRTHFKIIDKADTDRLSYSLVPKKVNVQKDIAVKLKEQEQNMELAQNYQKLELEQWFQQAKKQSQDSLQDQTISCTVLLQNARLEKNILIQYKQRPIDSSIQFLCPNSQLKGSLLSSSSIFTQSLSSTMEGSLSSCLMNVVQVPSFPPMPFPQSPTKNQQLKVHEFYSIEREAQLTLKPQDFYVAQIIQFPPDAKRFISETLQKNEAITEALKLASDSQLKNSDQLTIAILSNSLYKNMLIDDIESEKCEILKQITRQKRQMEQDYNELIKEIGQKHGLILFNQKLGKFKGDSDSDSEGVIDLDLNLSDGEESLMFDESCILQSMKYKQRSSQRAKQMWASQAIVQTFMPSFQPTTQQQIILQYDQCESPYTCMCCYLSYYDNLNPIVYCDYCDSGVHQRCYGIEDLDEPFFCDKCQMRRKRQDIDTPQKTVIQTTPSGVQSKTQNLCCIICNKPEGFMKIDTTYTKGQQTFFHVFCIFTSTFAFFKNISTLKQIDFDLALGKDSLGSSLCKYCQKLEEDKDCVLETCITCKSAKFHSMCAWLEGCQFTLKRIPLSDTQENSVRFQKQFYKMTYDFATEVTCLNCLETHNLQVFEKCGELSKARMFKWTQVERNVAVLKERKRRELTIVKEEDSVKSESQKQKIEVKTKKSKKDKKKKKRKAKDANEHIMGTLSTGETSF